LACDHGALVLSDEIYEELIFEGDHFSPGSEYHNIITINGFSKTYAMTGWRLGYVTGPRDVLEGMIKIYQHSASCVTAFAQAGALEALRGTEPQLAARRMVEEYSRKRELMLDLLGQSAFFHHAIAQGAFYCFPAYALAMDSLSLAKILLERAHVATVPGAAFGMGGEKHLRLSYSVSEDDMIEAFRRMESLFAIIEAGQEAGQHEG
jgi:aspartate aminotransferase